MLTTTRDICFPKNEKTDGCSIIVISTEELQRVAHTEDNVGDQGTYHIMPSRISTVTSKGITLTNLILYSWPMVFIVDPTYSFYLISHHFHI